MQTNVRLKMISSDYNVCPNAVQRNYLKFCFATLAVWVSGLALFWIRRPLLIGMKLFTTYGCFNHLLKFTVLYFMNNKSFMQTINVHNDRESQKLIARTLLVFVLMK